MKLICEDCARQRGIKVGVRLGYLTCDFCGFVKVVYHYVAVSQVKE